MKARWTQELRYTDGTSYDPALLAGFELQLDAEPSVSVPYGWHDGGRYEFPIADLGPEPGPHTLRILTVLTDGTKSEWSESVAFTYVRKPRGPFGLSIS